MLSVLLNHSTSLTSLDLRNTGTVTHATFYMACMYSHTAGMLAHSAMALIESLNGNTHLTHLRVGEDRVDGMLADSELTPELKDEMYTIVRANRSLRQVRCSLMATQYQHNNEQKRCVL